MQPLSQDSREFIAKPTEVGIARSWVIEGLTLNALMTHSRLVDIEIALGEVLQNIVRHQFGGGALVGTFKIRWEVKTDGSLAIHIFDNAPPLKDLGFLTKVHERSEKGGFGIFLIKKLANNYSIEVFENGNEHLLIF